MRTIEQFKKQYYETSLMPCLKVKDSIMDEIEKEVLTLLKTYQTSDANKKNHNTNFTKPYGKYTQSSLYNTSGNTFDFSTDYKMSNKDKFFFDPSFNNIHNIFKLFQNSIINLRLNGMLKNSGLSPHKVMSIQFGKKFQCRFHLPVITNSSVWVMLDWRKYWLKRGIIYFFNKGSVHSAGNDSERTRYHLAWDCMLDYNMFDNILNVENNYNPNPNLVSKISKEEIKDLMYSEPCEETDYEIQQLALRIRLIRRLKSIIPSF